MNLTVKDNIGKILMDNGWTMDFHYGEIIMRKSHDPIINEWGVLLNPDDNEKLTLEINDIVKI